MRSWNNDKRVTRSNGVISRPRVIVVEGLEAQAKEGATLDDLVMLIGSDMNGENPKSGIAKTLHAMLGEEHVVCVKDRWYLKEHAPIAQPYSNGAHPAPLPTNGQRVQVAAQVQKRQGKMVSLFNAPREHSDVVSVKLVMKGVTVPIPLWGSMWICYGQTVPDWDAEKELYFNVETIRLLFKNGTQHEEHPAPTDTVTIAQG